METVTNTLIEVSDPINIWFYISIIEGAYILYLYFGSKKSNKNVKFKKAQKATINMDDLMSNINDSKDIYKELSRKYHPDRYIDPKQNKIAQELFKEINDSRHNVKALKDIKIKAKNLL